VKFLLFVFVLSAMVSAQPSGPVIRSLGADFYLVQCNAYPLKVDDRVVLTRQGLEVGKGQVMRQEGGFCSIRLLEGQAQRFDLVSLQPQGASGDRGPALNLQPASAPKPPAAARARQPQQASYFHSLDFSGRVYQLNTGQVLTP
jgi:hypothetical protein